MNGILTAGFYFIVMVFVFGILIFIHELGHFFTARRCGVAIKEFAIGMGPTLFSWHSKKYETKYALRAFPIGGFVSMLGEDEASEDESAFCNKKVWQRMLITAAGPLMNLILGFILMLSVVLIQGPIGSTTVAQFDEGALSAETLKVGDEILKVDGTRVKSGNEVMYEIMNQGFEPIDILVKRDGSEILVEDVVFPTFEEEGVTFGEMDFKVFPQERTFFNIISQTFTRSISTVKMVVDSLIGLFSGRFGIDAMSGPIGVAEVVGEAAKTSALSFLYIVTVLTVNLGVFNLIPFPALDGGRFLFLIIEAIRRKPISKNVEAYINFAGIVILFGLMIFISFKDVLKLIFR
ncbi:MAG: site-2 protease family protein [Ruminococcaceae bacterium]|nr:site-2 protease family protein [Oscillospiraceae bacterium]